MFLQTMDTNTFILFVSHQHFYNTYHITFILHVYEPTLSSGGGGDGDGLRSRQYCGNKAVYF